MLDILPQSVDILTQLAGGDQATFNGIVAVVLILIFKLAGFVGRLIPDDKTGVLGFIRKVCKFVTLYTPNVTKSN